MTDREVMHQTLVMMRAWVNHWIDDVDLGLVPTKASLIMARAGIHAAIGSAHTNTYPFERGTDCSAPSIDNSGESPC